MNRWDRVLILVLALAYVPGTPGLGVDTRTDGPAYLGVIYGIAVLTPLLALAASWKWPRAAGLLGILAGLLALALPALDLVGVLAGPPPAGMIVVDIGILVVGLAVIWRSWPVAQARVA